MKLVVTGGGTGGHVYPALEIARSARDAGWSVSYFGSLRGQEGKVCRDNQFEFFGFPSEPIYSFKSIAGLKSMLRMAKAKSGAAKQLRITAPDVVFSTGGYSSAPVVSAAKSLGIPYVIHEQNTVPGRTNRILGRSAFAVAATFKTGHEHFAGTRVVRTGMPIRRELRDSAQGRLNFDKGHVQRPMIFVMGGSQGASALNEACLAAAVRMAGVDAHWVIASGTKHYENTIASLQRLGVKGDVEIKAFLSADEMAQAYFGSSVIVCRSGGSIAETAAFRKPTVLVPYPHAFADHQRVNALEFVQMGASQMIEEKDMSAAGLEGRIRAWLSDPEAYRLAQEALADWDIPDSADRILALLQEAAGPR